MPAISLSNKTEVDWNSRAARHLLQRAGFGLPLGAENRLEPLGLEGAVSALVDYEAQPDAFPSPDWITPPLEFDEIRDRFRGGDEDQRRMMFRDLRLQQREEVSRLKVWWLGKIRQTRRPLQEKMALFWHGHFAVSAEKVRQPAFNLELNEIFRRHATGNFRELVFEVGKSPAMLLYLDNQRNRRGNPNENWSRELLELFTLGEGNYTEADIKEAARAFSGYGFNPTNGRFRLNTAQHDSGVKTFLGKTGNLDGVDIIDTIFTQEAAAPFLVRKLWEYFAHENPDEALVERLATVFRAADYELKPLLRAMFTDPEFYSPRAMAGQIKSPVQFLVMLTAQMDLPIPDEVTTGILLRALGQDLFYPPNVRGWLGNRHWINTNTLLARQNIAGWLVAGTSLNRTVEPRLDAMGSVTPSRGMSVMQRRLNRHSLGIMRERLAALEGRSAEDIVDYLIARCLSTNIDSARRNMLVEVLAAGASSQAALNQRHLLRNAPQALHLLLSTAEYQLC